VIYGVSLWLAVIVVNNGRAEIRLDDACALNEQSDICNSKHECHWYDTVSECKAKPSTYTLATVLLSLCWGIVFILIPLSLKRKYLQHVWMITVPYVHHALLLFALIFNNTVMWAIFISTTLLTLPLYAMFVKLCIDMLPDCRPAPPAYSNLDPPADLEKESA